MGKLFKAGLKPYMKWVALLVLLLFVQAFCMLFLPNMMSMIIDNGVVTGDIGYITFTGMLMLLVAVGSSCASIGVGYIAAKVGVGFCSKTRERLFKHIDTFTLAEFDKVGAGSLTTRCTNDILQIQNFMILMLRLVVLAPIMCIGGVVLSLQKNQQLAVVVIICMPVILVFLLLVLRSAFPVFRSMQEKLDNVNRIIRENITGVRVVRAFTAEGREQQRFEEANADMTQASIRSQVKISTLMPMMMLIVNIGTVAVVWVGGTQISLGNMQVGDMMAIIQYLTLIMYALVITAAVFAMMPRASVCADRINEVLEIEPDIVAAQNPAQPETLSGAVEFRDVSLAYGDGQPAISHITFTANPGETTALIGATGSGKSSVISLIPRLRDVTEGSVSVDGVDVRDYDTDALRKRIGYVPQNSGLFSGTIRTNIAFGDEQMPMERVERAAKIAQADMFIQEKEKGYDDPISQGGTNVSGGQRQRLTIARAVAAGSDILVFDDSFSALDFKTDAALRAAIRENMGGATVIIVAQRVGTIMNADKILVLDQGRIVGEGKHAELMENCGVYAEIAQTQLMSGGEA